MLRDALPAEGSMVGRRHVRTLLQRMAIEAVYHRPRMSIPAPGNEIFLLRELTGDCDVVVDKGDRADALTLVQP
jgi:hypothetical protein